MSKRYKKRDYQPFNIILVIVILFILTPVVPFAFGVLFAMYLANFKGKYGLVISGILLLVTGIFFNEIMSNFLSEFQTSVSNFLNCIIHGSFNYDFGFFTYKSTSWLVIFFISIFLASYFKLCIDNNKERKQAGIRPLEDEIKKVNTANANNLFKEKPYIHLQCFELSLYILFLFKNNYKNNYSSSHNI